ncbi:MAG: nucleotide sugar dehydrogenase [Bdellovibrionota bacterium]
MAVIDLPREIGIVGVGYVGLPLAVCFSKVMKVRAYDRNPTRIQELSAGIDRTNEVPATELGSPNLLFTSKKNDLKGLNFFIVTVPTPVDKYNAPDLTPLFSACEILSEVLQKGATVVFESTVYPGLTEEVLAPKLEELTGLKLNVDFFLGYSPERVNPGDKEHTIPKIKKIVSGSNQKTLELVAGMYSKIVAAGIHCAKDIRTAEAAKVIENIQRDVNIGLINELTVLFDRLGLDVHEVLEASGTKWNFLKFKPGLVGGHCIGVDPYYLTHKSLEVGYHPEMILAGRRTNDSMPEFFAEKLLRKLLERKVSPIGSEVLVLGFTFKENCPDVRNTKVVDLVRALQKYGIKVDVADPIADRELARKEYGLELLDGIPQKKYTAAVLAVPHAPILKQLDEGLDQIIDPKGFLLDIKGIFPSSPNVVH